MSPRKPSSIFLLIEKPQVSTTTGTFPPSSLQAFRLELNDQEPHEVIERYLQGETLGTTYYVVEDTKVKAYRAGLALEEIDDPRLGQDEATQ